MKKRLAAEFLVFIMLVTPFSTVFVQSSDLNISTENRKELEENQNAPILTEEVRELKKLIESIEDERIREKLRQILDQLIVSENKLGIEISKEISEEYGFDIGENGKKSQSTGKKEDGNDKSYNIGRSKTETIEGYLPLGIGDENNNESNESIVEQLLIDRFGWVNELVDHAVILTSDLSALLEALGEAGGDGRKLFEDAKDLKDNLKSLKHLGALWKRTRWFNICIRFILFFKGIQKTIESINNLLEALQDLKKTIDDTTYLFAIVEETYSDLISFRDWLESEPWKKDIYIYGRVISWGSWEGLPNVLISCRDVSVKTDENGYFGFYVSSEPRWYDIPPIKSWPREYWPQEYWWLHNCSMTAVYNEITKVTTPLLSQVFSDGKLYWLFCFKDSNSSSEENPLQSYSEYQNPENENSLQVDISVTPLNEGPGEPITITVSATGGSGNYYYTIDFGDGNSITVGPYTGSYSTTHTYGEGTYYPSVTVVDSEDSSITAYASSRAVHISELKIWKFTSSTTDIEPGETVWFTVTVDGDNGVAVISIDFEGDGIYDKTAGPTSGYTWSHVYDQEGVYSPQVKIVDANQVGDVKISSLEVVNGQHHSVVINCQSESNNDSSSQRDEGSSST